MTCENAHRRPVKARVRARHAVIAFAPLFATYLVAAERVTLGGSLDLLWLLLTVAAVIHALQQKASRASRLPQLVSLALVLALFFPVISLDDDHALAELPGEQQSLISAPAKQKCFQAVPQVHVPQPAATLQVLAWQSVTTEAVAAFHANVNECVRDRSSGNHSPPLA